MENWDVSLDFLMLFEHKNYGFSLRITGSVQSFLTKRVLKIVFNGNAPTSFSQCVIRQGYILVSTLFVIFINNIPDVIIFQIFIYADDKAIYTCT